VLKGADHIIEAMLNSEYILSADRQDLVPTPEIQKGKTHLYSLTNGEKEKA
jgi:hypothetical protein